MLYNVVFFSWSRKTESTHSYLFAVGITYFDSSNPEMWGRGPVKRACLPRVKPFQFHNVQSNKPVKNNNHNIMTLDSECVSVIQNLPSMN